MDVNFLKVYIEEIKRELGETYSNRPILRGFQGVSVLRIFNAKWGFNFKPSICNPNFPENRVPLGAPGITAHILGLYLDMR